MSLIYPNRYPGRWDSTSAQYPQGKFKNRSSPTAKDGSFCEMDWANDWAGFFGAILKNAGVTPNGSIDTATASQLYDALRVVILGVLPKRTFSARDFIRIPDVPGGLIIQWGNDITTGVTFLTPKSFPTPFPSLCILGVASYDNVGSSGSPTLPAIGFKVLSNNQFSLSSATYSGAQPNASWIAVGF
ncbi:MAG: gp53-like domain-containing protein [Plesiomonas sp.]